MIWYANPEEPLALDSEEITDDVYGIWDYRDFQEQEGTEYLFLGILNIF